MTGMLIVKCEEYLQTVREFADATGKRQQLERKLQELTAYLPDDWTVELNIDFAPYSFFWTEFSPTGQRGLIGGLIYHGQHDGGGNGGAPTFSVSLEPCQGWAIHT